jgi:hypothetical protein
MKNFFKNVWNWIVQTFYKVWNKVDEVIGSFLPVATNTVEAVKKVIENPLLNVTVEVIKSFTPDVADKVIDKAVELLKEKIPQLALQLKIVDELHGIEDKNEQVRQILFVISQGVDNEKWEKFLSGLAQEILYALSDGKITWGEAGALVEYYYQNYIKEK